MHRSVLLNAARLDYDGALDLSPLERLGALTRHEASAPHEVPARADGHAVLITKELKLGPEVIAQLPPSVRLICEAGTGYDNIDLAAARARDIAVCNAPGYSTSAVAQLAMTFVLDQAASLSRRQRELALGQLDRFAAPPRLPLAEVQGKALGVVGFGAIGREVARLARAFGMEVLVHTRRPVAAPEVRQVELDALFRRSDFVTLHCPLTAETRHLVDRRRLRLMKPGAFLVNVARGAIVREADLVEALRAGELAGAALDVQDPEPPPPGSPLYQLEQVVLTPHIGWKPVEARQRLIELVARNIAAHRAGKAINRVA